MFRRNRSCVHVPVSQLRSVMQKAQISGVANTFSTGGSWRKGPGCVRLWLPYLRCFGMTIFAKGHFAYVEKWSNLDTGAKKIKIGHFQNWSPCSLCQNYKWLFLKCSHKTSRSAPKIWQDGLCGVSLVVRGVFQKFVAFDTRATDTQLKPTTFLYIISLIGNAHKPVVLQALNY